MEPWAEAGGSIAPSGMRYEVLNFVTRAAQDAASTSRERSRYFSSIDLPIFKGDAVDFDAAFTSREKDQPFAVGHPFEFFDRAIQLQIQVAGFTTGCRHNREER